ncbi:hypothetical protein [Mycolicibacterium porcinum]|uniref:Uncharacterized protein n=1 Tax=Mycolicibacterium porcinum TaxID=39693 RepID=A0ABV3VP57_9MYCO
MTAATHLTELPAHTIAQAAVDWIDQHRATWLFGSDTDPGAQYPITILSVARAESRFWISRAGTLYGEVAALATGHRDTQRPGQTTLETLRRHVITVAQHSTRLTPELLVDEVTPHLPSDTTPDQNAALIWWSALLIWAVTTS